MYRTQTLKLRQELNTIWSILEGLDSESQKIILKSKIKHFRKIIDEYSMNAFLLKNTIEQTETTHYSSNLRIKLMTCEAWIRFYADAELALFERLEAMEVA